MKQLVLYLKSNRFKYLIEFFVLLAFGQVALFVLGGKELLRENNVLFDTVVRVSAFIMFFLFGCAGIVGIIRQEFRQIIPIKGKTAQVIGFVIWIFSWAMALYVLYLIVILNFTSNL